MWAVAVYAIGASKGGIAPCGEGEKVFPGQTVCSLQDRGQNVCTQSIWPECG